MTLREQINWELDDVYPEEMERLINETYPDLKLDEEVPNEVSEQVSDILYTYAK